MFQFFKRRGHVLPVVIDYVGEWRRLQTMFADPAIELAKSKQASVVSAASVLDRIWNGNGGLGWDESCVEDYIAPLREHLIPDAMFSEGERAKISVKLDEVVAAGSENARRIAASPDEEVELESSVDVNYLVTRVVDWCLRYPDLIPIADEDEYKGHY